MVDLPKSSVIIAGLEYWDKGEQIPEPRLVDNLKDYFEKQGIKVPELALHAPPPDDDDPASKRKPKIVAWQFPEWFITQTVVSHEYERGRTARARRLVHRSALTKGRFIDEDRVSQPVVPVRFVQACRKGTSTTSTGTPSSIKVSQTVNWHTVLFGWTSGEPVATWRKS